MAGAITRPCRQPPASRPYPEGGIASVREQCNRPIRGAAVHGSRLVGQR